MSSTPYRVLWLTENHPPQRGGMAQSCDRIVNTLRQHGVTIDVVHFSPEAKAWRLEEKRQGRHWTCPTRPDPAHAMQRLWNQLEAAALTTPWTHVVAFGGLHPMSAAPAYAAWLGCPLLVMIRGNDFDLGIFTPRRQHVLDNALKRAACICSVSEDKRRKIQALYPDARVVWTPNGIDHKDWQWLPSELAQARAWRAENIEPSRRVLGIFGHIKPKKGAVFLLRALQQADLFARFHLLLIGALAPEVQEWIDAHEEALSYTLLPFQDRFSLLRYYAITDLVALPSFYDGTPNVVLEATSLGVPILGSTAGGIADDLEDRKHGFFFHPGDHHACRWALHAAAAIPEAERLQMGEACQHWSHNHRTHNQEAQRYLQLLQDTHTKGA